MSSTQATYTVEVDTGDTELYDTSGDDVTADVRPESGRAGDRVVSLSPRGRDVLRRGTPPRAGGSHAFLDNSAGAYGPASAMTSGHLTRVRATDPTTGTVHDLFTGITQEPTQLPRHTGDLTALPAIGTLSRLAGGRKGVSTTLSQGITIDAALGLILDAASWPKNLIPYLQGLDNLVALYGMGESSGDILDQSTNSNDLTVTLGAGARAAAALDDAGDGSLEHDGADTKEEAADHASITDIFDGGGRVVVVFDPDSDGEGSDAHLLGKGAWSVRLSSQSGSNVRLDLHYDFDGAADGHWHTAVDLPITGVRLAIIDYDADAPSNQPTIYLWDGSTFRTLTVGSGLTEATTPSGGSTRVSDSGDALVVGNNTGQTATTDGHIGTTALYDASGTAATAKAIVARALNAPRHLDTGIATLEWHVLDDAEDVWQHVLKLWRTEGPGSDIYEDGTGAFTFKSRHARLTDARSTAVQTTFNSAAGAAEPLLSDPFTHDDGKRSIINSATLTRRTRSAKSSAVIWSLGETLTLGANETWTKAIRDTDRVPFTNAIAPVVTTDYTVDAGAVSSVTLDRTSGTSAKLTIVAGGAGATLSALQVRGQTVSVDAETDVPDQLAASSVGNDFPLPSTYTAIPEISLIDMQSLVDGLVSFRKDARAKVAFTVLANRGTAAMTAALSREVSDRIRVNEATSGVDINAHIGEITHTVEAPGFHITKIVAEQATAAQGFILDTSKVDGVDLLWF